MNKSYKHNVEWKKPDMMLFDSTYRESSETSKMNLQY